MRKWNSMIFTKDEDSVAALTDMLYGYQKSRVLLTACELEVFTALGTDVRTSEEIAVELNLDNRATDKLMSALTGMKLLDKTGGRYSNTNLSLRFLVKSKPDYIGLMDFNVYLWNKWSTLTESVRKGTAADLTKIGDMCDHGFEAFLEMVNWRSSILAKSVVDATDFTNINSVLELGGGTGDYALAFLKAKPDMECSVFAYEKVIPRIKEYYKDENVEDKINLISGDYDVDDFGSGYDMIFISFVAHHNSIFENIELSRKIYNALNEGGKIVVQDYYISDDRTKPVNNSLFALETLVNSESGDTYTESEMWIILREAKFRHVEKVETEFGTSIISAQKVF